MWQTSAWFLLVGALVQFGLSIAAWAREFNADLIADTGKYREAENAIMARVYQADVWTGDDVAAAQAKVPDDHRPGRDALIRRHRWRYGWNAAGWALVVVGAAMNLTAAYGYE